MNPYENIAVRPVRSIYEEKKHLQHIARHLDLEKPVSAIMVEIEEVYPELSIQLRKYCVWAANIVKQFFPDIELWDAMEIMERWAENPCSVSGEELSNAYNIADNISRQYCVGHYCDWITDKSSVSAYVVKCLTDFKQSGRAGMLYIEQAYKLHIEYSTEIIVARNNLESARKLAQLNYDPNRSEYKMLGGHQLVINREYAKNIQENYNRMFELKINEARKPQWEMFNQMILSNISVNT